MQTSDKKNRIFLCLFAFSLYLCTRKVRYKREKKGNGVEISDCPAAVSSIIPTSNGPLPEGGKAFEGGTESEDLPYVNSPTLSM